FADAQFPSMTVTSPFGVTACGRVEYNPFQANANIVVLRSSWDEEGANKILGLTTVTYNSATGELLDADIEINGLMPISGGHPGPGQYDLQSILTHEAGHFFGLTHSPVGVEDNCHDGATMCPSYDPGSEDFRTLEDDDVAGICTIYPPDRDTPACDDSPKRGFSPECGLDPMTGGACAIRLPAGRGAGRALPLAIGWIALVLRRLRRGTQKRK
ncbi:MAG: matrixin family metalloprotease, partial [Polyangiaceae bacterium]